MRSSLLDVMGRIICAPQAKGRFPLQDPVQARTAQRHPAGRHLRGPHAGPAAHRCSFVVVKDLYYPGAGPRLRLCLTNRDYTMIMGTTIFLAFLVITANVVVDIVYKFIDPRIKLK